MLRNVQKKIVRFVILNTRFFVKHLAHIVFLVFTLQLLVVAGALPYLNLISQYSYYVFTAIWIFTVIIFPKHLTTEFILKAIIFIILLGIPVALMDFAATADALGYVIFVLIATVIVKKSKEDWGTLTNIRNGKS